MATSNSNRIDVKRRKLLKAMAAMPAMSGVSMMGAPIPAAQAQAASSCGPRSLVCIFLAGGADSFNMFIPGGARFDDYQRVRSNLAVAEQDLLQDSDARLGPIAFNSMIESVADLYRDNRLAVIANCGPLIRPTTQQDYLAERSLPQSLFAHDAQQRLWQNGGGSLASSSGVGWGGRIADYAARCNAGSEVTPAFSISGTNLWQSSINTDYITLRALVPVRNMDGYNNTSDWIPTDRLSRISRALVSNNGDAQTGSPFRMEQEVGSAYERAFVATTNLRTALANNPVSDFRFDSTNKLAGQLHYVAQLIASREELGMQQQVFFVRMGGWDTHSEQLGRLPALLGEFNDAIGGFQQTIDRMQKSDTVTSFTSSDFGRTLTSNGDGTDHGWGGHAFVFGGAVAGGQVIGTLPDYSPTNNADDTGDQSGQFAGRLIPTISVSQYGATIARWMGIPESDIPGLFPDLANFSVSDLGFMQS